METTPNSDNIREALQTIIDNEPVENIRSFVAQQALDYATPQSFFKDMLENGCARNVISDLTNYNDTHQFFHEHFDEIEEIREEFERFNEPLQIQVDVRSELTWMAVETIAIKIGVELELILTI